jgi:membrane-associated phospholipid phosphatase
MHRTTWISRIGWVALFLLWPLSAMAGGGPFGIDYVVKYDDSGIWARKYQLDLQYVLIAGEIGGALWEGGETRLGRTYWQAIDSSMLGGLSSSALKVVFSRKRPSDTNNPNEFFKGGGNRSFPSGEVTSVSAIVTPFVLEYRDDHPAVYALELLPLYDAIARVKVHGHWQSDVIAGFALGTYCGWYAHSRSQPFILSALPHGFMVGWRKRF